MQQESAQEASNVAILLGASNLTLAWPRIVTLMLQRLSTPLQIYTAHGMGRSYCGEQSGFAFRKLPGILKSGLWDALPESGEDRKSFALITDLGNDLVYGRSPEEVAASARECVERLWKWNASCRIVVTRPPVESVETLGSFRYRVARRALFPRSNLQLADVKVATRELDARIVQFTTELHIPVIQPQAAWYGIDPIHLRRRHQSNAFAQIFDLWSTEQSGNSKSVRRLGSRPTAALRWVFGREKQTAQPVTSHNETHIHAY